jgi:hypothetical protein
MFELLIWGCFMSRSIATILGVGALVLLAGPAAAQTVYATNGAGAPAYPSPYNAPNQVSLSVQVLASIGGRCGFATGAAPSGSLNQTDFDTTGFDQSFAFTLNCTALSRVAVVSSNGGLKAGLTGLPSGYAAIAPYDVQLNLVGNSTTATATCGVGDLLATAGATCAPTYLSAVGSNFKGPATTSAGLLLNGPATNNTPSSIRVKANAYGGTAVLASGTYTDTLTVTVSPAT